MDSKRSRPSLLEMRASEALKSLPAGNEDLLAELGLRMIVIRRQPEISGELRPEFSPQDVPQPPRQALIKMGQDLLSTWNRALFQFVCVDTSGNSADRQYLLDALKEGGTGAIAALTDSLIGTHLLNPAVAVIVAALIIRMLIVPAGRSVCQIWKATLQG